MKKIIAGIAMMLLVSSVSVYASGGGKKKARKAARKTECCTKKICCEDQSKCTDVKYSEKMKSEETNAAKSETPDCSKGQSSCAKQD